MMYKRITARCVMGYYTKLLDYIGIAKCRNFSRQKYFTRPFSSLANPQHIFIDTEPTFFFYFNVYEACSICYVFFIVQHVLFNICIIWQWKPAHAKQLNCKWHSRKNWLEKHSRHPLPTKAPNVNSNSRKPKFKRLSY